jgi:hypothetical protein
MQVFVGTKTVLTEPSRAGLDMEVVEVNKDGEYEISLPAGAVVANLTFIQPFITIQYYRIEEGDEM